MLKVTQERIRAAQVIADAAVELAAATEAWGEEFSTVGITAGQGVDARLFKAKKDYGVALEEVKRLAGAK